MTTTTSHVDSIECIANPLADPRGPPPDGPIFLNFMQFLGNFEQLNFSVRTQVLYKTHVLYCALFLWSSFFPLEIAKRCFIVLYFLKNVLYFLVFI